MNNEKMNQIIYEAYKNYWSNANYNNLDCLVSQEEGSFLVEMRFYYKDEFINKCKTDPEFSEKWGLKIEERELSRDERIQIYVNQYMGGIGKPAGFEDAKLTTRNIPTKLITITHNNEKTEIYE